MKTIAIIPIKARSRRVRSKNFKSFCGKPLYQFFLNKLTDHPFDEIIVDTDSKEIAEFSVYNGFSIIERNPELASDSANGNDLLLHHAKLIDSDIYFQLFITSPYLRKKTINQAYDILIKNQDYDSLFTATKIYSWFWFDSKPVNYDPKILPRSQDATPIIKETTGLYAIRKEALLENRCRIGKRPFMLFVDEIEGMDIDTELDFSLAEYCFNEGLHKK